MSSRRKKPEWDASISDLSSYKLSPQEVLAKKQSLVSENKPLVKRMQLLQKINKAKKEGNTKGVLRETIINNQNQQNMSLAFINNINSKETKNCPDIYELSSIVLFLHQKVKQLEENLAQEKQARLILEKQVDILTKNCLPSENQHQTSKICEENISNRCPVNSTFLSNNSLLLNPTTFHQTLSASNNTSDNFSSEIINETSPIPNKMADDITTKLPNDMTDNNSDMLHNEMSSTSNEFAHKTSDIASLSLKSSPPFDIEEIENRLQALSNRQAHTLQQVNKLKQLKFN